MRTALPVPSERHRLATLDQFAAIPEEEIWLTKQKSKQTRRAYRLDVQHFIAPSASPARTLCARSIIARCHRVGTDAA